MVCMLEDSPLTNAGLYYNLNKNGDVHVEGDAGISSLKEQKNTYGLEKFST